MSSFSPSKSINSEKKDFGNPNLVTRKMVDKVEITGKGDTDFVIKKKLVETSKVDLDEYVNSFADDVGILNIYEKITATGDTSLLQQRNRVPGKVDENGYEEINDVSKIPGDYMDVKKAVDSANNAPIDKELKQALQNMSDAELNAYLKARYGKKETTTDTKEGDK